MADDFARPVVSRDYRIDLLRGLSILSVLLLHFHFAYNLIKSPIGRVLPEPYLVNLVRNGNYGVTVFFVISGYLITSTSLRRFGSFSGVSARVFYAFRFARIFPCLLLVLAIITALAMTGFELFRAGKACAPVAVRIGLCLRFGITNLWPDMDTTIIAWTILWSLSVSEEVFYLGFPTAVFVPEEDAMDCTLFGLWLSLPGPIYRGLNSHNEIKFLVWVSGVFL